MLRLTFLLSLAALPAWGYVDPGAASYFLQLLIGTIFGALFFVRQIRSRIFSFFNKLFKRKGP